MDPKEYLPRVLEASYLAAHPDLTPKARELLREEIARHPERYAPTPAAQALMRYADAHARVLTGLDRIIDLPDGEFNARRVRLFGQVDEELRACLRTDPTCQEAKLLHTLLADTDADTCLHDVLLLEQETLELIHGRYPRFDEEAPHFWQADEKGGRSGAGSRESAAAGGGADPDADGAEAGSARKAANEKDGRAASDAGRQEAPATPKSGADGTQTRANADTAPATAFAAAALRRSEGADAEDAAWLTSSSPEVIAWLHMLEAISQLALSTARYRAAIRYADMVMRALGYPHRSEGTLLLAYARLEDEAAFFDTVRRANELLPQNGPQESSPWFLFGRALLFYKLGKERPAKRALKDFAARADGGAFFLTAPLYHTPYLPVRPTVRHAWELTHQALYEADGIIVDTPDFVQWAEGFEEVRTAADRFADAHGFD